MNIYIIYQIFIVDLQNEKYLSSVHSTIFCAKLLFPPLFPLYFNIYKYIPLNQNYVHESIKIKKKSSISVLKCTFIASDFINTTIANNMKSTRMVCLKNWARCPEFFRMKTSCKYKSPFTLLSPE